MEQHILGRTGVQVSKLCLGAMMFGAWGNPDHDDSIRIIHRALDAGHQLRRHRRRLLRRRVRGDRRQGAQGPPRRRRPGHQVPRADGRGPQPARQLAALDHPRGRGLAAPAAAPTGSTSTRSTAPTRTPTSRRRSARSPTSSARARSATSAPRPSRPARSSRRSGSRATRRLRALRHRAAALLDARPRHRGRRPARPAQRHGMGILTYSPLAGGWLSGRWRKDAGQQSSLARRAARRRASTCRCPTNQRKLDAVEQLAQLAERGRHLADRARDRLRRQPPGGHRRRSSARARWSSSRASSPPPTSSLDDAVLDRIDEIVPPGIDLNPADNSFDNPALRPTARRR